MLILLVFGVAFVAALLATPAAVRILRTRGIYGHVRASARTAARVPRLGGIPIIIATTAALAVAAVAGGGPGASLLGGVMAAGWLLFLAGLADDLWDLRPGVKLLVQCLAAIAAFSLGFRIDLLTFAGATLSIGVLALPLTIVWIVVVTNAFNLIDGLDGLATGIALVALGTTFGVSLILGNVDVAVVCAALGGALLGFLPYNFRPARIFLGDSGSLFIGFMVAVLSVDGSIKSATAVVVAVPLLVLALPLLDTMLAVLRRWLRGKPVFGADEHHLHHRLLSIGLTHVRAVVLLYVVAAVLAAFGVLIAFGPPRVVTVIALIGAVLIMALLLAGIRRLGYHEFVEARVVVRWGLQRMRQSISDRIHARDVAQVIARGESVEAIEAILQDNASALGLMHVVICDEDSLIDRSAVLPPEARNAWRIDCPVGTAPEGGTLVLRVWTSPPDEHHASGTDRVVAVIATAVCHWMDARALGTGAAEASAGTRGLSPAPAA